MDKIKNNFEFKLKLEPKTQKTKNIDDKKESETTKNQVNNFLNLL